MIYDSLYVVIEFILYVRIYFILSARYETHELVERIHIRGSSRTLRLIRNADYISQEKETF
jgi:hypothetical protein